MGMLSEKDRQYVENMFQGIEHDVKLVVFSQSTECPYCRETREIVEELAGLSGKVAYEVYDFVEDSGAVERFGIEQIPAVAILGPGEEDYGIRFYGIPSGYEFSSLLEAVLMVGKGTSGLAEETRRALADVSEPVHMKVFVTPTCPYCPQAVHLAHQMALENSNIRAEMIEAIEFPHLANRYNVRGVPRTVINEEVHVEGALPEHPMLHKVLESVGLVHRH